MTKTLTEQIVYIQNDLDVVFANVFRLEKKLEIAKKALNDIRNNSIRDWDEYSCRECSVKALKEMEGVK